MANKQISTLLYVVAAVVFAVAVAGLFPKIEIEALGLFFVSLGLVFGSIG